MIDRRWRHWLGLTLLAGYLISGVYFVAPEQQAVVTRFNRLVTTGVLPGVHYHLPWPIERVARLKVLETKRLTIGIEMSDQVLGRRQAERPVEYLTGDQNIINVQIAVQYTIMNAGAYLYRSREVTEMVGRAVESAFATTMAAETVDVVLTTGKVAVQNATMERARLALDGYGSGIFITSINIESVAPPAEVADAFRDVASARADRDRITNEAHGYANDLVAKAHGEAEKMLSEAEGDRQRRINEATGDAARFVKLLTEASRAREITERRLYLETTEEVLPRVRKVVIDSASGPRSLMDLGIIQGGLPGQAGQLK